MFFESFLAILFLVSHRPCQSAWGGNPEAPAALATLLCLPQPAQSNGLRNRGDYDYRESYPGHIY
jgi:hypothetical protein